MKVPPWAGFVADFPDDQVENTDDIQVFGGRNVAVALGEIFESLGCRRVSEPWSAGEVGWEFDFQYDARGRFWCRVQSFHPVFWLLFEDHSLSDGEAYVELWRKFGNVLERDPRFHKILWRPFKAGPPDWDEVEAASDPPKRTFDEEFPPSTIEAKASRPSLRPYVIGVWLMLSGAITPFMPEHPDLFHRIGYAVSGVFLFLLGAFFFLIGIGQRRENLLAPSRSADSPGRNRPARMLLEELPARPARPRVKAAGGPLAPAIIGAWFVLGMGVMAVIDNAIHGAKAQAEVRALAVVVLLVGLAVALRAIGSRREIDRGSGEDPDSAP